nr:UDP-glycosyltransferase 85C2-like [Tanacetum cinerariifolium]
LQITFVNTENIHKRMLKSGGPHCLDGSSDFRFEAFPDGIPRNSEEDDVSELILPYVETTFLAPFLDIVAKLPNPPTCIVSDGFVSVFTVDAAQKLGIPIMLYWTLSACGFMGTFQVHSLIKKGLAPPKDENYLTNGYLDTIIDWIPGMEGIRIKDMSSIVRITDPNHPELTFCTKVTQKSHSVSHNIFHTFDALEPSIVDALSSMYPKVYTVAPMLLEWKEFQRFQSNEFQRFQSNPLLASIFNLSGFAICNS